MCRICGLLLRMRPCMVAYGTMSSKRASVVRNTEMGCRQVPRCLSECSSLADSAKGGAEDYWTEDVLLSRTRDRLYPNWSKWV